MQATHPTHADPPFHPWEVDNGVSRTSGGREGGDNRSCSSSAEFYAMQTKAPSNHADLALYLAALKAEGPVFTIPLPHVVHTIQSGWLQSRPMSSPTLPLQIRLDRAAYIDLQLPVPTSSLRTSKLKLQRSCADTGAQLLTVPTSILGHLGIRESDLFPVATNLNTVTGAPVDIIGGVLLTFTGINPHTGITRSTRQLAYVSRTVPYPFLSREACHDLGLIPDNFPSIGSCNNKDAEVTATVASSTLFTAPQL